MKSFAFFFTLIGLDQLTKWYIAGHFYPGEVEPVFSPWLNFTYVQNRGALFGVFSDLNPDLWEIVLLLGPALMLIVFFILFFRAKKRSFKSALPYALLISGGACNLFDRVTESYVVDFIELTFSSRPLPAFNFADLYLGLGLILFVMRMAIKGRKPKMAI